MTQRKIIVIGGGVAGLMAAGQAAQAGAETLVLEKNKQAGRKLCITGKGRCNITNIAEINDFIGHFGKSGNFLRQAFFRFFSADLMDFFEELGLELITERGGRVFPASGKAGDVLSVLLSWFEKCGAEIRTTWNVDKLIINNGAIEGILSGGKEYSCDAVILATGGASYPATGSTGDGYRFAISAGHTVVPVRPALVPLETSADAAGRMAGLKLHNIRASMFIDNKKQNEWFGEILFTESGVSGPVILTLSGIAVDALREKHKILLSIDLKPALDEKKLDARLVRDFNSRGKEQLGSLLGGVLPREMIPVCLSNTGIPSDRKGCTVSEKERRKIRTWLKDFRLEVTGFRSFAEAIITAGGINTGEINPRTMESRLVKGLFFAGELIDIHADTGGYNLQAAFSTGWLAGRSAAAGT